MAFMPYIHFSGSCAEAMAFYADIFGSTDLALRYYEAQDAGGAAPDLVLHAQFTARGAVLMASDYPPGMPAQKQAAMSVMIDPATVAEGQRVFGLLAEGGTVVMPFGPTFWSAGFGMLTDRFGTHWMIGAQGAA